MAVGHVTARRCDEVLRCRFLQDCPRMLVATPVTRRTLNQKAGRSHRVASVTIRSLMRGPRPMQPRFELLSVTRNTARASGLGALTVTTTPRDWHNGDKSALLVLRNISRLEITLAPLVITDGARSGAISISRIVSDVTRGSRLGLGLEAGSNG